MMKTDIFWDQEVVIHIDWIQINSPICHQKINLDMGNG